MNVKTNVRAGNNGVMSNGDFDNGYALPNGVNIKGPKGTCASTMYRWAQAEAAGDTYMMDQRESQFKSHGCYFTGNKANFPF